MKRFFVIFSTLVFVAMLSVSLLPKTILGASADTAKYGLIGENVILYNAQLDPITTLPATYFVIITGEDETYYSINYNDLNGYVEKIRVFAIDYEPRLKFASGFFTAQNDTHSVIVRTSPTSNSESIGEIAHSEKAYYYGTLIGEALIPAAGNVWYYVRFAENKYGYVYSAQGIVDSFAVNPGDKMPTNSELPLTPSDDDGLPDWVFILLLCVPAVVIMLALFGRNVQKNKGNSID